MIASVKLKNWRSHLETEFVFSKGTNALIGISGAGKSSVTDAISFALFGTFPDLQQKKLKLDDVIMNKPFPMTETEVEVEFVCNENLFKVKRRVEKGKGTNLSELRQKQKEGSWKLLESPKTSAVTERVESILEIDYDLFSRAIYSNQNRLDFFLDVKPGKRKELIDELLGIDKYEKARVNITKVVNTASTKIKDWESALHSSDPEELKKNEIELEQIIKKLLVEKSSIEKSISEKENKTEEAQQFLKKYVEKEKKFNELNQKKAGFLSSINSLGVQFKEKKSLFESHENYAKYSQLLNPDKNLLEVKELLAQIKDFELQLEPVLKEKNLLEAKLNSADEDTVSLMSELKKSIGDTKPSDIQKKLKSVEEVLTDFEKEQKELEEKAKVYHGKKVAFERELVSGEDEFKAILSKIKEIIEKEELFKKKTLNRSIDDLRVEKDNFEKERLVFEKKYSLLDVELNDKKEAIKGLEKSDSKCPLCESEMNVEKRHDLIEKNNVVIALNKNTMEKIQHDIKVIVEKIKLITELTEESIKMVAVVALKKELIEKKLFFEKKLIELKKDLNQTVSKIKLNESIRSEVLKKVEKVRFEKESLSNSHSTITRLCNVKSNAVEWKKDLETVEKRIKEINSEVDVSKKESLEIKYRCLEAVCEVKKI
ncbi:MAG: SMC family ATPase, partial [Candidatus Diapherotrites archaeon]|nr:SMC family ATPase [Candidatus Diapherotrites archaeon]